MSTYRIRDVLSLDEIIRLMQVLVADDENTHRALAANLHARKSDLCVLKWNFEFQTRNFQEKKIKELDFSEPKTLIDDVLGDLRIISHQVYPKLIEQMGLLKHLESYVSNMVEKGVCKLQLNTPGKEIRIVNGAEVSVFRLCVDILSVFCKTDDPNLILTITTEAKVPYFSFSSKSDLPETADLKNKINVIKARMLCLEATVSGETNWRNCIKFGIS